MSEKPYTWQDKIENLVTLAKAVGQYTNTDVGTEGRTEARRRMYDLYAEFCEWRHDEPYVLDEIQSLLRPRQAEYVDELSSIRMIVICDNAEHPLVTVVFPEQRTPTIPQINMALARLRIRAGITPQDFPNILYGPQASEEVRQRVNSMAQQYAQGADAQRLQQENEQLRALLLNCFDLIEELRPVGYRSRVQEWREQAKTLGVEVQE